MANNQDNSGSPSAAKGNAGSFAYTSDDEFISFALSTARLGAWDLDLEDHTAHRSLEHDRIFGYQDLLPRWTYEMFLEHVLPGVVGLCTAGA